MNVDDAYRTCQEITWREARNFAYGIRLLPPAKLQAMTAIYALARRIDDIGDGDPATADKLTALAGARADVRAVIDGVEPDPSDPVLVALADAARRHPVPLAAFEELIDGCEADVVGTSYATFDELVGYCRNVAGSIGRLSLGVFETDDPDRATPLADSLGVALQLTNILRDIVEDHQTMGRVYLPAADIEQFGCRPDLSGPPDAMAGLIRAEAATTRRWYDEGLGLLPLLDRRSRACVAAMAGIYRRLLDCIDRDPHAVLRTRVSVPGWQKALVAARSLAATAGPGARAAA